MAASNLALPAKLDLRANLARLDPIVRQVFIVHHLFIVIVIIGFAAMSMLFAAELAGGTRLGRWLSGAVALFWLIRLAVQLGYYDPDVRRRHRLGDVAYTLCVIFLALAYSLAALNEPT